MSATGQLDSIVRCLAACLLVASVSGSYNYYNQDDDYSSPSITMQNCQNSIVQASSIAISCDSPYTFYYGNGAHRNSAYCDYADKATIDVCLEVTADLGIDEIYMSMGVYAAADSNELLYSVRAASLCQNIVGESCTTAGSYCFQLQTTFDTPSGSESGFLPIVTMAFSTYPDEGYDQGGVNINCQISDSYGQYDPWMDGDATKVAVHGGGTFVSNYGLLLGVGVGLVVFSLFAASRLVPEKDNSMNVQARLDLMRSRTEKSEP